MPNPYIPAPDADFATWLDNFDTLLTASPATYGLVPADAAAVATVTDAFLTALAAASNPGTRTPVSVALKDTTKITSLATVRPYAQSISLNAGVDVSDKINIGVNPRTTPPTPINAPATNPVLTITGANTLAHVMRYRDEMAAPNTKAKPYGAVACQIFGKTSATPITDALDLPYLMNATKSPLQIFWQAADANKIAYYAGRWITRRGLVGPWSPIISFTVPNG
jgi:hypothetical protein